MFSKLLSILLTYLKFNNVGWKLSILLSHIGAMDGVKPQLMVEYSYTTFINQTSMSIWSYLFALDILQQVLGLFLSSIAIMDRYNIMILIALLIQK